ncbi:GNAT family N-acetyltransferase [Marinimicrobium sp. ABcell2]|uniref:GNAT family N-acetyltransferase n=1 Tax=Marinimicrobium sp. ABcell2 TaxID=3069751 RepID=UPI0027AECCA4|nr:GNAT family N-acetyltransferase [Marinimicrobium sp. ABcell2]MDQ2076199.1 GNAT family N-acetyltransferase [Marinimicrobium sp. ABcell2]
MNPEIQVRCFTGIKGLEHLKPAWEELFRFCVNPCFYNDWRWHYAVQRHLAPCNIHYFAVYEGDELIGVLPLSRETQRCFGFPIVYLRFPTHTAIDASDLLLRENKRHADVINIVLKHIDEQGQFRWDVLELTHFTTRSSTYALIGNQARPGQMSAFVERDEKGLISALSKKKVKNTRRHRNKAEMAYGPVTFTSAREADQIRTAFELFLDVEAASWKGPKGTRTAIRFQSRSKAFYEAVLSEFADTREAQVDVLYVGGKPAAAQMGLRSGDRLALLKIGYDDMLKEVGPGAMALLCCLEKEERESRELNLVTNPAWAQQWHFNTEPTWNVSIFNTTAYARLLRIARPVYIALKRVWGKLNPSGPRRRQR